MKGSLHDGTVTVQVGKNSLLAVVSHQMSDWQGFGKHLERSHRKQRVVKCVCMWTTYAQQAHVWTSTSVCCSKWRRVRTSQNRS